MHFRNGRETDTVMDEAKLIEKLRLIEALFGGAGTEGERVAAERARERILERLGAMEKEDPPVEYTFTMSDMWMRKVFVALLRRYGITPYRYKRQRYTTVMARVSKKFVDETLWPEFEEFSDSLRSYLSEVTERVVSQVICADSSEAEVVADPSQLPARTVPVATSAENNASSESSTTPATTTQSSTRENAAQTGTAASDKTSKNKQKRKRKKKRKRR